jgi:molybdopterin converting factor small subunit
MGIKISIPWFFQRATGGAETVELEGNTVGDCLKGLVVRFPALETELFDKQGKLSPFIDIYLDGRSVRSAGLDTPVANGDGLSILLLVDGG